MKAFTTYVRPILEYCSVVWSPFYLKDIILIEKVQRRFTKRLFVSSNLTYSERLKLLELESLEERRIKTDLLHCFKTLRKFTQRGSDFFQLSKNRYNDKQDLFINYSRTDMRKFWFAKKKKKKWNKLSPSLKCTKSLAVFKEILKETDLAQFCRGPGFDGSKCP